MANPCAAAFSPFHAQGHPGVGEWRALHHGGRPPNVSSRSSIRHKDGHLRTPRLLHYMDDRMRFQHRWEGALDDSPVPTAFLWGLSDPVSGAHVLDSVRHLDETRTWDVGHYPQWERPSEVAVAILEITA